MEGDRVVGIRINGDEIWFCAEAFDEGRLAVIEGGEQCEGCGEDILDHPLVLPMQIKCRHCGTRYDVVRGTVRRHSDDSLRVKLDAGQSFAAMR